jgi:cell division protein FtsB
MDWRRLWRRGTQVQTPLEWPTDARRVAGRLAGGAVDPDEERRARRRRRMVGGVLGAVCAAGTLATLFGHGGLLDWQRLRLERRAMERKVQEQRARVEALQEEVRRLESDPLARERIAREQLGLALPGEITFVFADEKRADDDRPDAGSVTRPER